MTDLLIERIVVGDLETNCYILVDKETKQGFVVDPGGEPEKINRSIKKLSANIVGIINTHAHFDHIRADDVFDLPVYIHGDDAPALGDPSLNFSEIFPPAYSYHGRTILLKDGEILRLGSNSLKVLHTPGHSPGGICILTGSVLLSGDTLFQGSVGRTDIAYGNSETLLDSIRKKLLCLSPETIVWPGHGRPTTIGEELRENPFLHG